MNLKLNFTFSSGYTSKSQIARVLTEFWVKQNAYCPSCGNDELNQFNNNSPVADFFCKTCKSEYGAYNTMIERLKG